MADGAKELCRSDGAAIALCELGTEVAVIRYWPGMPSRGSYGVRIEPGQGIGGLVLAPGRPCRTDHYARDPRLNQEYLPLMQAGRTVGVLVVPIRGGEQQMLAIGRALMARPRVLLLDEPSMGLAPTMVEVIFDTIQEINRQGTTILLVEQNALMALEVAHRGYVLQTGRTVLHDTAANLLQNAMVRKVYLGLA